MGQHQLDLFESFNLEKLFNMSLNLIKIYLNIRKQNPECPDALFIGPLQIMLTEALLQKFS